MKWPSRGSGSSKQVRAARRARPMIDEPPLPLARIRSLDQSRGPSRERSDVASAAWPPVARRSRAGGRSACLLACAGSGRGGRSATCARATYRRRPALCLRRPLVRSVPLALRRQVADGGTIKQWPERTSSSALIKLARPALIWPRAPSSRPAQATLAARSRPRKPGS